MCSRPDNTGAYFRTRLYKVSFPDTVPPTATRDWTKQWLGDVMQVYTLNVSYVSGHPPDLKGSSGSGLHAAQHRTCALGLRVCRSCPFFPPFVFSSGVYAEAVRERASELEESVRRKNCALRAAGQRRGKDLREAARETSTAWGRATHVQDELGAAQKDNASLVTRVDDAEERASFVRENLQN